jgi:hypothetical protein
MKLDDVEQDTIQLRIKCSEDGDMRVSLGYDLSDGMDPEIMAKYLAIAHGIMAMLEVEPEVFIKASMYLSVGMDLANREAMEADLSGKDLTNISVVDFKGKMQ